MTKREVQFDFERQARIGLSEAVLCEGKSPAQIEYIVSLSIDRDETLLLTRLGATTFDELSAACRDRIDFDVISGTGVGSVGQPRDGDPRSCYVIQEDDKITFHRVKYDFDVTAEKIYNMPDLDDFLGDRIKEGR